MKYIRTKDGIFEVIEEKRNFVAVKFAGTGGVDIHKEMIKKQADDIKELFDEQVLIYKDGTHHFLNFVYYGEPPSWDDYETYGAIWKDNGLIYVAKMNEEGEWDLL